MGKQQVRLLPEQPIDFQANSKVIKPLRRGMILRELSLRLFGAITCTAANNLRTAMPVGDEWALIQRLDIVVNGSDNIRSFTGEQLWWLNRVMYGMNPSVTPQLGDAVSNGAGSGTANPAFDSVLKIPFWMPRSTKPFDTVLDTAQVSDIRIEVQWGTFTSINSNATAFTTTPQLQVQSLESFALEGQGPFLLSRIFPIIKNVVAANQREKIEIPVGTRYRGFLINCKSTDGLTDNPFNPPTNTVGIQNIKLTSGGTTFVDIPEPMLREGADLSACIPFALPWGFIRSTGANVTTSNPAFGGITGAIPGNSLQSPVRNSSKSDQNAWLWLDMCSDGYLSEAIDTRGWSELTMELDMAAAQQVTVFPFQIVDPQ